MKLIKEFSDADDLTTRQVLIVQSIHTGEKTDCVLFMLQIEDTISGC
jgi:hypothetical protein